MERNIRDFLSGSQLPYLFSDIPGTALPEKSSAILRVAKENRRIRHRFLNITRMRTEKLTISLAVMEMKRIIRTAVLKKHRESRQLKATEAENPPYTITEENYTYFSNGNKGEYPMQFDVKYPQITGVEGENH